MYKIKHKHFRPSAIRLIVAAAIVAVATAVAIGYQLHYRSMRFTLMDLQAQNQADTVFRSDSLQLRLVHFFDRHAYTPSGLLHPGRTANDRLLAHYLLGRAYADMGDAPMAIEEFEQAKIVADTANTNCDFKTLRGMYGQIATLFHNMDMPDDELIAWDGFRRYSLIIGDTLSAMSSYYYMTGAYHIKCDTTMILEMTQKAHDGLLRHGYIRESASIFPTAIHILLIQERFSEARKMMDFFENESGLFDANGNIINGCEEYYVSQGLYHLGIRKYHKADSCFRKALSFRHDEEAYYGLLKMYQQLGVSDSVSYYATLYAKANDSRNVERYAHDVIVADKSFNFILHKKKAESIQRQVWILIIFTIILSLVIYICIILIKQLRLRKQKLNEELCQTTGELFQSKAETKYISRSLSQQVSSNTILSEHIIKLKDKNTVLSGQVRVLHLLQCPIVRRFKTKANKQGRNENPTEKDWIELESAFMKANSKFTKTMSEKLMPFEKKVCMLTALNVQNSDIATMLASKSNYITKIRGLINEKIFGKEGATGLSDNILDLLIR